MGRIGSYIRLIFINAWKIMIGSFLTILAAISVIISLYGISPSPLILSIAIIISFIGAILVSSIKNNHSNIPDIPKTLYTSCICSRDELKYANNLASPFYGKDSLDYTLINEWRKKNENIFVCLKEDEEVVAAFSLIPIKKSFMDMFISGRVIERQLTGDDIYGSNEDRKTEQLYIAGLIVKGAGSSDGKERAKVLIWTLIQFYKKYYLMDKERKIYFLATTPGGYKLGKRFSFDLCSHSKNRLDKHDLYVKIFSRNEIQNLEKRLPNYNQLCNFTY